MKGELRVKLSDIVEIERVREKEKTGKDFRVINFLFTRLFDKREK
jgi:hypothetical protein